jgi:fused signal recognition particle receptor
VGLTGLILTKLDGTARGGVVVAIADQLKLPITFVGLGEGVDDLQPFVPEAFTDALFARS